MNKDNKVFANEINKKINNNEKIYYSNLNTKEEVKETKNIYTKNIYQKINDIFNSRSYIYKADVVLTTKNGTYTKRLVGKNSNYLITVDNELIPIVDVLDIKYQ